MKLDQVEVLLLHENKQYLEDCADLLNKQWKRSTSARLQSLENSYKDLPDSLLLIEKTSAGGNVIGHSRLTRVLEDATGCWIGSVIITEEKRKQGYGKYLMLKTEEYAKSLQFSTVYLNTQDQQGFYEHLGYSYGKEVSSISFKWQGQSIFSLPKENTETHHRNTKESYLFGQNGVMSTDVETIDHDFLPEEKVKVPLPPPLPPPLPVNQNISSQTTKKNLGQYWMQKAL